MKEFYVCNKNSAGFSVWGPSLEYVAERFPKANVFDASDLSKRIVRYIPE